MNTAIRTLLILLALLSAVLSSFAATAQTEIGENQYIIFYHHDALGNPVAASDHNGNILWHQHHEPFGRARDRVMPTGKVIYHDHRGSRQGYTGHLWDSGTDLVYMKARFYDPLIGRFYSNDPVGFNPNNPASFNRYAYVNNNPYRYVDPTGENLTNAAWTGVKEFWEGITGTVDGVANYEKLGDALRDGYDGDGVDIAGALAEDVSTFAGGMTIGAALKAAKIGKKILAPKSARNPGNGLKLNRQLGSQQQLGENGVPIAGAGSKTPLRDSNRLANEYGGNAADWAKRSSTRHKAPDGRSFETHWYENSVTGQRVEPKTIVEEYLRGR